MLRLGVFRIQLQHNLQVKHNFNVHKVGRETHKVENTKKAVANYETPKLHKKTKKNSRRLSTLRKEEQTFRQPVSHRLQL